MGWGAAKIVTRTKGRSISSCVLQDSSKCLHEITRPFSKNTACWTRALFPRLVGGALGPLKPLPSQVLKRCRPRTHLQLSLVRLWRGNVWNTGKFLTLCSFCHSLMSKGNYFDLFVPFFSFCYTSTNERLSLFHGKQVATQNHRTLGSSSCDLHRLGTVPTFPVDLFQVPVKIRTQLHRYPERFQF